MGKKNVYAFLFILMSTFLVACSQGEKNEIKNEEYSKGKTQVENVTDEEKEFEEVMFQHVHGLAYELSEPYDLFLGTHHGVYQIKPENFWTWLGTKEQRHDVMGFNFIDKQTMISSGHPSDASNLKNPIGVIISTDNAESWEPISLHGDVDFHTFEVNASDSGILYGIDASGFYRSIDAGYNWEKIQTVGLPENLQDVYSLISNPGQPYSILAGTKFGVFKSDNGAKNWKLVTNEETIVSAKGSYGQEGTIVAYIQGKNENGLVKSDDFGETWNSLNLTFEDDAVAHIAIHPVNGKEYTVGTFKGDLYRTNDNGVTWTQIAKEGKSSK